MIASRALERSLDRLARGFLAGGDTTPVDFRSPPNEAALAGPDSVSWRVFKNPLALFVGGVAAVILELAEPRVRTGVWEHSGFRTHPLKRLQRTGLAAMVTVYAARSQAERMIAGIRRMHDRVAGHTPSGESYSANDVGLLTWVQATAVFGFGRAYHGYVARLDPSALDSLYEEGLPAARLYGALDSPSCERDFDRLLTSMRGRLEPSPVVFEFLDLMQRVRALPAPLQPVQRMLVRAAVELTPAGVRECLGLTSAHGLRPWETPLVKRAGALADSILLPSSPAVQACLRLGLPADHLYRNG